MRGVDHFDVELGAVDAPGLVGDRRERGALAAGHHREAGRQRGHPVAVAHPHLLARARRPHAAEQRTVGHHVHVSAPELPVVAALHGAAQLRHQRLLAVADAQDRQAHGVDAWVGQRRRRVGYAGRAARQDDAARRPGGDAVQAGGVGQDLAVDAGLAQPPGDELCDLAAEIQDQDAVRRSVRFHGRTQHTAKPGRKEPPPTVPAQPICMQGRACRLGWPDSAPGSKAKLRRACEIVACWLFHRYCRITTSRSQLCHSGIA